MSGLLTTAETAQRIGVPEATLRWWRHRGDVGPKSFTLSPGAVRYREEDVDQWIEARYTSTVRGA